jgi:hypothetical protein
VLRADGETESTQENMEHRLKLDVGDSGLQLLTREGITAVIFLFFYISTTYVIKLPI